MNKQRIPSIWDYEFNPVDLSKPAIARWYLKRRIEYADWKGLEYNLLKKHLKKLDIDSVLKTILQNFIQDYEKGNIK